MSANNLPIQVTSFVGRAGELTELAQLLPTTRLLTLAGAGGTGKTRLALQLAANVLDTVDDGVWFIDLGPLSDPALVPLTIASVLGVRAEPGRPLTATLQDWLRPKNLLLILDNCEHLIEACAQFADAVLHGGRETRILATSREALGIAGELAWRVPSLPCPNPLDARVRNPPAYAGSLQNKGINEFAAVQLFIERAKFANAKFALTDANGPAVEQICYQLDGIPLAIELAAARVKSMRAEQIAARLDDRFRLLTGSRTALPRHQTLRSLMDWSHGLLPEAERVLLRRLSVFAGGWTLEAAEAICCDEVEASPSTALRSAPEVSLLKADILDLLSHLVDKSLVVPDEQAVEPRYRMLETIRQYAREKLLDSGERERLHHSHLAFFQKLAQRTEPPLLTAQRFAWIPRLKADNDNMRTALDWACERDLEAARAMAGRLSNYWFYAERLNEARAWYKRVLGPGDRATETEGMALALLGAGWVSAFLLALDDAEPLLQQSIALWRVLDDKARLSVALSWLCFVKIHQGESEVACAIFEANESTLRRFADPRGLAWALNWWARALAAARGDFGGARMLIEQSQAVDRQGKDSGQSMAHAALGYLATQQGDYALAKQHMPEALSEEWATPASYGLGLGRVADVTYLQGDYAEALILYNEASAMFKANGDVAHFAHILTGAGFVAVQQGEHARATAIFSESLEILRKGQFHVGTARCLVGYAALMLAQGHAEQAARLLASETVRSRSYKSHIPIDRIRYERTLAAARAQLDDSQFDLAWADGSHLTLEQTIAEARHTAPTVNKSPSTQRPPREPNTLTARELEVLRLVAAGLSNAQIAARLVISRRTVQTHLTSVYGKFAVESRSAATRYALDHKLL